MIASVRPDKVRFPAPGVLGGRPGLAGRFTINGEDVPVRPHTLKPGDIVTLRLPGGGGYGKPKGRPRADILRDINEGYVSPAAARRDYGVSTVRTSAKTKKGERR